MRRKKTVVDNEPITRSVTVAYAKYGYSKDENGKMHRKIVQPEKRSGAVVIDPETGVLLLDVAGKKPFLVAVSLQKVQEAIAESAEEVMSG